MSIYENTQYKPNEIGIFAGLDMDTYRVSPGLAGSDLELVTQNPAAFNRGERTEPTEDMDFGSLFHSELLTGDAGYHVQPDTYPAPESTKKDAAIIDKPWNWGATFCKEWRAEHSDLPILPKTGANSAAMLAAMVAKCKAHKLASQLISRLTPEVSVFSRSAEYPVLCKGRLDGMIRGETTIIVEVKTTRDASTAAFSREILKRGYYKKAAWYRMLLHELRISPVEFWFIAVEKSESPRVNVRRLAERAMDKGDFDNDDAMKLYMKCKLGVFWPELPDAAFPGDSDSMPLIDLPDYAYGKEDEALVGMTETDEPESQ